jgi:hypothetical protein
MNKNITIGDKYDPAMKIMTQEEADFYFEECVQHTMNHFGVSREKAEEIERINLGYYAGYYSQETRARVEKLFRCEHPFFGSIEKNGPPSTGDALWAGVRLAGVGMMLDVHRYEAED